MIFLSRRMSKVPCPCRLLRLARMRRCAGPFSRLCCGVACRCCRSQRPQPGIGRSGRSATRALPTHDVRAHARRPIVTVWHHGPRLRPREQRPRCQWPGLASDGALGPPARAQDSEARYSPKPEAMGISGVLTLSQLYRTTQVTAGALCDSYSGYAQCAVE
jgi:hypothetical protein